MCTTLLVWTSDHSTRWGRVCDTGEVTPICTIALATPATVHLDPYTKEGVESLHILIASKGKNVHTVNLKYSEWLQSKPWKSAYLTVKPLKTVKVLTCSCNCHRIKNLWKWRNYVYIWPCLDVSWMLGVLSWVLIRWVWVLLQSSACIWLQLCSIWREIWILRSTKRG